MSEVNDWGPPPKDDWQPVGSTPRPTPIPGAFLDRMQRGAAVNEALAKVKPPGADGEASDHDVQMLTEHGVLHDPVLGTPGMVDAHSLLDPSKPSAWDQIKHALGSDLSRFLNDLKTIPQRAFQQSENLRTEDDFDPGVMLEAAMFGRIAPTRLPGGMTPQAIGAMPRAADFTNAARLINPRETAPPEFVEAYHGTPHAFESFDPDKAPYYFTPHADVASGYAEQNNYPRPGKTPNVRPAYLQMDRPFEANRRYDGPSVLNARDPQWLKDNGYDSAILRDPLNPKDTEYIVLDRSQIVPKFTTEDKLRELWQERGIHPAEAAHDAERDAFLRHDLSSAATEPTTLPPADVPFSQQPAPPAGRLAAAVTNTADALLDIGKDIQMKVAPMATGTTESMAAAKDFANTMRRNRWEWSRVDDDIVKRFDPEQRKRMWDAADEESVARQLGESTEHQGLVTLTPVERAAVEAEHTRAQNAWVRAYDVGLVEGEGLPAYTPRMVINTANAVAEDRALPLNSIGSNLKTTSANLKQRKHMTAEETEAAAKGKYGEQATLARDIRTLPLATAKLEDAIAGRSLINNIKEIGKSTGNETVAEGAIPAGSEHKWFTLDHPAFRTWRPRFERNADGSVKLDGNTVAVAKDAEGHAIFEQVPIYIRDDFEGPLRAVLQQKNGALYSAAMSLKGKTMSLIMYSPAIHNMVEFGRAFPAMPTRIFKAYFDGNRAKNDVAIMGEAIDNGLVPIGRRFFKQNVDDMMAYPNLTPGDSWTAKVLSAVPGLFDEGAGTAVKQAVDKAGNFWHNTLLWDRIADLQMGIYVNMRGDLLRKGVDPQTSSRVAAHLANRYAGALPQEAMSAAARKAGNMIAFSRTFTLGNLGVMKDMLNGMPKDVLAQIERDMGTVNPEAVGYAKSLARRKATATVMLDIGLMYVGNSVLQSAFNVMLGDHTIDEEMHGYVKRMRDVMNDVSAHPLSMLQPFDIAEKLSATSDNEPGRKERVKIGYQKDGTAIYARNPVGKIGEEFTGWLTSPLDMSKRKLSTVARPALQVWDNDKGFGRKVYDPNADTPAKYAGNIWAIVEHFAKAQTPEGQITAFSDLVKGDGDPKTSLLQSLGPFAGVTFSKGAPGGPAVGELYKGREIHDYQVNLALPDIRKQIQRGDVAGAQQVMTDLHIPPGLQRFYIRTSQNPATRLSPKAMKDFYLYATPEQRDRMERVR